jgi:hypothetical protein
MQLLGKFVSYKTKNNAFFSTLRNGNSVISLKTGSDEDLDFN